MDTSEIEHEGGEFFKSGQVSNRKEVDQFLTNKMKLDEAKKAELLEQQREAWLNIDNPYIWEPF